jgi:hypothetical protein
MSQGQDKIKSEKIIPPNMQDFHRSERIVVQESQDKKNEKNQDKKKKIERNQDNKKNEHSQDHNTNRSIFHAHGHENKKNEQNLQSQEKDIITEVDEAPITKERKVPKDLSEKLGNAGL